MNSLIHFVRFATPMGPMLLVAHHDALSGAYFEGQKYEPQIEPDWRLDPRHPVLRLAQVQLAEYFTGARTQFDLPLAPAGTPFQIQVWAAIAGVPYGKTASYHEIAFAAGRPQSVRAAGAATGRNPLSVIVPCHRIIGSDGALTGYAGGLDRKRALLALETEGALARAA
ncbi:MAG TPA: methylated-DNA--[protein]-cysteine S-methyltransferase [Casimicrobiaceae bacterium]